MERKYLFVMLLAVLAVKAVVGQNDELHIPLESDNQFPPEDHIDSDDKTIEGSGNGEVVKEPVDTTTEMQATPEIEDIRPSILAEDQSPLTQDPDNACPTQCVCNVEGDTDNFVVDCSGYGLTEFPSMIDPKTTTLNLQNNKLTEIPKEISALKNLRVLNANNNEIMELASGSISELPELVTLKLANNRLIEYPRDLQNSLILNKLEELDLGGNDMRTKLASDAFHQLKSLKKLILPNSTPELLDELCLSFKGTLEEVCTGDCKTQSHECSEASPNLEEDLLDATLPGMIAYDLGADNNDPGVETANETTNATTERTTETSSDATDSLNTNLDEENEQKVETTVAEVSSTTEKPQPVSEFSLRTAVNKEPAEAVNLNSIVVKNDEEAVSSTSAPEVNIGAKTSETKTGGVDKSVIGIIVAGMIIVVAVITIKKNWSSISKRFSSSPRPANNRAEPTANGTSPEEVPLQDKSPV